MQDHDQHKTYISSWGLSGSDTKHLTKLDKQISIEALKLKNIILTSPPKDIIHKAVFSFYRKFYSLTLSKTHQSFGLNRPPARDKILDFPWQELKLNRFECLKLWEKISK